MRPQNKICPVCLGRVVDPVLGPPRRYCGERCRRKGSKRLPSLRPPAKIYACQAEPLVTIIGRFGFVYDGSTLWIRNIGIYLERGF